MTREIAVIVPKCGLGRGVRSVMTIRNHAPGYRQSCFLCELPHISIEVEQF